MNVRINLAGLKDEKFKAALLEKVQHSSAESNSRFKEINQIVENKLR